MPTLQLRGVHVASRLSDLRVSQRVATVTAQCEIVDEQLYTQREGDTITMVFPDLAQQFEMSPQEAAKLARALMLHVSDVLDEKV